MSLATILLLYQADHNVVAHTVWHTCSTWRKEPVTGVQKGKPAWEGPFHPSTVNWQWETHPRQQISQWDLNLSLHCHHVKGCKDNKWHSFYLGGVFIVPSDTSCLCGVYLWTGRNGQAVALHAVALVTFTLRVWQCQERGSVLSMSGRWGFMHVREKRVFCMLGRRTISGRKSLVDPGTQAHLTTQILRP